VKILSEISGSIFILPEGIEKVSLIPSSFHSL